MRPIHVFLFVALAIVVGRWIFRALASRGGQPKRFVSVGVLLRSSNTLDRDTLLAATERAWNVEFPKGSDATDWVVGEPPLLMVKAEGVHFTVNVQNGVYAETGAPFPEHAAWFSIDFMASDKPQTDHTIYQYAGKLVASLLTADSVAIMVPSAELVVPLSGDADRDLAKEALTSEKVVLNLQRMRRLP